MRPRYCLTAGRCRRGCRVLAASSWLLGRRSILSECLMHSANTRATLGRRTPSLGLSKPAKTRSRTPADSDNVLLLRQYRVPHHYNVFKLTVDALMNTLGSAVVDQCTCASIRSGNQISQNIPVIFSVCSSAVQIIP